MACYPDSPRNLVSEHTSHTSSLVCFLFPKSRPRRVRQSKVDTRPAQVLGMIKAARETEGSIQIAKREFPTLNHSLRV